MVRPFYLNGLSKFTVIVLLGPLVIVNAGEIRGGAPGLLEAFTCCIKYNSISVFAAAPEKRTRIGAEILTSFNETAPPEYSHVMSSNSELLMSIPSNCCLPPAAYVREKCEAKNPHLWQHRPEVGHPSADCGRHFWMRRYYDFNVYSESKISEKLYYMHQNPVERGLVRAPEEWAWSSFRAYAGGDIGIVKLNDWGWWEERIRASAVS